MNVSPKNEHIPRATIQRLATYLQVLEAMHKEGVQVISSEPLSRACDVNASQVRKDLAYFGEFGVRGVGYYVSYLLEAIKVCLHANREWRAALVGVGNLGRALLNHREFRRRGFTIVAAFDCDPFKIGETAYGLEVYCTKTLMERVPELNIEIGIITTPPERAQRGSLAACRGRHPRAFSIIPPPASVCRTPFLWNMWTFPSVYSLTFNISNRR